MTCVETQRQQSWKISHLIYYYTFIRRCVQVIMIRAFAIIVVHSACCPLGSSLRPETVCSFNLSFGDYTLDLFPTMLWLLVYFMFTCRIEQYIGQATIFSVRCLSDVRQVTVLLPSVRCLLNPSGVSSSVLLVL